MRSESAIGSNGAQTVESVSKMRENRAKYAKNRT